MSGFLYPFLEAEERDAGALLADLAASARRKADERRDLSAATVAVLGGQLDEVAAAIADRLARGGRLFTFGNGGSATDAAGMAALFVEPPVDVPPLPARSLTADEAVLTALSNDVGFEVVYARQLIAHAHEGDVAVGLSTSGNSDNVLRAFEEARRRGLLTVGLAGYDGGAMAACAALDHLLVVRSDSVHRIQEAQATVIHELWRRVHRRLEEAGPA